MDLISERPEAGSPYIGNSKRVLLRRFPFFVVHRLLSERAQIVFEKQAIEQRGVCAIPHVAV